MTDTPERELIESLIDEAMRLQGRGIDCGCVDSSLAGNLAMEAADTIEALLSRVDKLEEALNAIIDRAPERNIKWAGMTARDIAIHALNRSAS